MRAGSINLQRLFEQTIRYRIPLFQRPYVWNEEENWQPIWDDVRSLAERQLRSIAVPPHFLGAIVLDQIRGPVGGPEVRQVIDGQQRLTTVQILLAVLRDLARQLNLDRHASRFEKLTTNDPSFCDSRDEAFKVWPTNRDRDEFRKTMTAGSSDNLRMVFGAGKAAKTVGTRIADAYLYFERVVTEWVRRDGVGGDEQPLGGTVEERFEALWSIVRSHLQLVAIDLDEQDDAQVIFETLNARGTQLLPADLVKNYLFRLAELEQAPLERLYERYWQSFDEDFWREEVRQGRLKRPRIDLFFQHYLSRQTAEEVAVGHIFSAFRHYVENGTAAGAAGTLSEPARVTAEDHLIQLKKYGEVFLGFYRPVPRSRAELFFQRLDVVDTATVFPFLLEAFHQLNNEEHISELEAILVDLESYLVRRMICGLTTKHYNRFFLELVGFVVKSGEVKSTAVREFLLKGTGDSVRWPDDEEFSAVLMAHAFYRRLSQPRQRMVLLALDRAIETGKSESVVHEGNLTIEHLMPQSWTEFWPLLGDTTDEVAVQKQKDLRGSLLHTIGNLTLLTDKLNPAVSNSGWSEKCPEILKHSKLNLNRYFQDRTAWNEVEILKRSKGLFAIARTVWPHPA